MKKCIIRQMFFEKQRKRVWLGILCSVCMVLSLVLAIPVTALAGDTAITSVKVEGVDTDLNTSKNFTMGSVTSGKYEIVDCYWTDGNLNCNSSMIPKSDRSYYYWVKLQAKDGYYFQADGTGNGGFAGSISIGNLSWADCYTKKVSDNGKCLTIQTCWIKPTTGGSTGETPSGGSGTEGSDAGTGGPSGNNSSNSNNSNTSNSAPHTHSFAWCTITEPTAEQDGLEAYACTTCGYYEESVPVSAYSYACHGGGKTGDLCSTGL